MRSSLERPINRARFSEAVLTRENFICQDCGDEARLAHDPTGLHKDISVGVALCGSCHFKRHRKAISPSRWYYRDLEKLRNGSLLTPEVISQKLNMPMLSIIELLECKVLKGYKDNTNGQWQIQQKDFIKFLKG